MPGPARQMNEAISELSPQPLIHVTHVLLSLDYGGLERVVVHLVAQAARMKQRTSVLCLEHLGAQASRVEQLGATLRCISKPPGLRWETTTQISKVLEEWKPDVVHTHQIGALFYTGPAASRLKVPVIVHTEHGKTIQTLKQKLLAWYAAKFAQKYYCVSTDIARSVTGWMVPRGKVEVVANGIDVEHLVSVVDNEALRKSWNIPPEAVVIGTVGRLAQVKRQDLMLDVFQRVRGKIPGAILLVVGDGPKRKELEQQAKQLGVYDAIRFAGFQSEPGPFLHLMSAFLLTSESEGMPMSLLEAWAVGVPAISFRVGGLPELIHDGETGFLADFGDTEKMARHIVNLVDNGQLAQRLAAACRRQARERFDVKVMAKQYDDRYRQLLAGRQG